MKSTMSRLFSYIKPFVPAVLASLALAGLISASELVRPYIIEIVIDEYIMDPGSRHNIYALGALYFGGAFFGAAFQYWQEYLLNLTGQKIIHNIRMDAFRCLAYMPFSFFDRNSSGRLLTRVTSDIEALNELYSGVIVSLVKDAIMLAGIVAVMLRLNFKLALVSFCIVPIIVIVTLAYNKRAKKNFSYVRTLFGTINGFLAENISGMRLVQTFNRQKEKFAEFTPLNEEYNKASVFSVMLNALFKPSSELINALAISIIIWYAAGGVLGGTLEIGVLYAFITYIKKFFGPINDLADKYGSIQTGMVSAERIFELLAQEEQTEDISAGLALPKARGEIEFRGVWFAYNDEDWVLRDVSFHVRPGETVAFVGHTGSGKTTIVSLLGRFYEVQKGEILLDGVNIKKYRLPDLRKNIAIVMQDVFLFATDIKSNIRLNNNALSDRDVEAAAEFVNAADFIRGLPGGFEEKVTERGATLSTGQRQLLNFARAVAFQPAIIILDEATSSIDTENEAVIQQSLRKISGSHTSLVIAHRLSTVEKADNIIVISRGEVQETGSHQELLRKNGAYRQLYDMQFT
ncbi:MAG: ABC transporter ATP-binding protein/permease [Clostridiales bacterium]|jgi:ATP-binding cassette subfamily B protein|nr:ABC transporter ATP-binding protein/permease [Clostridiales bacterium]